MSEIMVRERFLRSGKKVYEYSFEMASVDGNWNILILHPVLHPKHLPK